jgi:SAM-dependent methyltransferase
MKLLPRNLLIKTGPVDEADWVYRPLVGPIARWRFGLVTRLLGSRQYHRILELGYGSGIFLPELLQHCDELFGVDIHAKGPDIAHRILEATGKATHLATAYGESLPYSDGTIDCVVAVSALEFVSSLDEVCKEVARVLRPDGRFVFVTPGNSPLLDWGLKLLTNRDARQDFGDRRQKVLPAVRRHFAIRRIVRVPPGLGAAGYVYLAADCRLPQA